MLRKGITEPPPDGEPKEHPLFGAENQAKLRAIEVSDVWLGLREGLYAQREALLAAPLQPGIGETLEARWGAIQQLSLLLHGGPQMILQYTQLAAKEPSDEGEREYTPKVHTFQG